MNKQCLAILFGISLIGQPAMAAHLSVISWEDAVEQDAQWNSKIIMPSREGRRNLSPLCLAIVQGKEAEVKSLIDKASDATQKSNLVNSIMLKDTTMDPYAVTPLHYAAMKGDEGIMKLLLDNGADVNAKDSYGRAPLLWAFVPKHTDSDTTFDDNVDQERGQRQKRTVQLLLDKGADRMIRDNLKRTPLHWAVSRVKQFIVPTLLEYKGQLGDGLTAEYKQNMVRAVDAQGNTPLHYAVSIRYAYNPEHTVTDPMIIMMPLGFSSGLWIPAGSRAMIGTASIGSGPLVRIVGAGGTNPTIGGTPIAATQPTQIATEVAKKAAERAALHAQKLASIAAANPGDKAAAAAAAEAATFADDAARAAQLASRGAAPLSGIGSAISTVMAWLFVISMVVMAIQLYAPVAEDRQDHERRGRYNNWRDKDIIPPLFKYDGGNVIAVQLPDISDRPAIITRNRAGQIPSHFAARGGVHQSQTALNTQAEIDAAHQGGKPKTQASKDYYPDGATSLWQIIDKDGVTPLMYAIMRGNNDNLMPSGLNSTYPGLIYGLTEAGNPDAQGTTVGSFKFVAQTNMTPLKLSLVFGDAKTFDEVYKRIVEFTKGKEGSKKREDAQDFAQASQEIYTDSEGRTVLHYAGLAGRRIREVYQVFNNIQWQTCLPNFTFNNKNMVPYRDAKDAEGNWVPMLLAPDKNGATPLHYAAMSSADGIKFLMEKLEDTFKEKKKQKDKKVEDEFSDAMIALKDKNGMTPLHYAAMMGKTDGVEAIMRHMEGSKKKGKTRDLVNIRSLEVDTYGDPIAPELKGKTAAEIAQARGFVGAVEYLNKFSGSDEHVKVSTTKEAKKERRRAGKVERRSLQVDKSLEKWKKKAEKKKKKPQDPLIQAAQKDRETVVKDLVKRPEQSLLVVGDGDMTALDYAVKKGHIKMVSELLGAAKKRDQAALDAGLFLYRLQDPDANIAALLANRITTFDAEDGTPVAINGELGLAVANDMIASMTTPEAVAALIAENAAATPPITLTPEEATKELKAAGLAAIAARSVVDEMIYPFDTWPSGVLPDEAGVYRHIEDIKGKDKSGKAKKDKKAKKVRGPIETDLDNALLWLSDSTNGVLTKQRAALAAEDAPPPANP